MCRLKGEAAAKLRTVVGLQEVWANECSHSSAVSGRSRRQSAAPGTTKRTVARAKHAKGEIDAATLMFGRRHEDFIPLIRRS